MSPQEMIVGLVIVAFLGVAYFGVGVVKRNKPKGPSVRPEPGRDIDSIDP